MRLLLILYCSLLLLKSDFLGALPIPLSLQLSLLKYGITSSGKLTEWIQSLLHQEPSFLEAYCHDLTQRARDGKLEPVIGREKEVERIIHLLSRKTKNNPILIGKPGVGKTAIVEGLAQRIIAQDVPSYLQNKKIFSLDIGALLSGTNSLGALESRVTSILQELEKQSGAIILFIDEIHTLSEAKMSDGGTSITNLFKPALARGTLHCIGATTLNEYKKYIEKDSALARRFQPVLVEEPTVEETLLMLRHLRPTYEHFHNVTINDEALETAIRLSVQLIPDRHLPDKAIDLIDEACSLIKTTSPENNTTSQNPLVNKHAIASIVAQWTHIPIEQLSYDESQQLLKLEKKLHERVVGQHDAIAKVANAIRIHKAGIHDHNKPLGSFLFVGPTGVGKTEVAKTLAHCLFHDEKNMIRIDMSEYTEKHAIAKLIGAPPGYIGYEEGGLLTEAVRRRPYSIILFDEVEKAHPEIFTIFLQLLDDGRLTDAQGNTVSFKNCIIIMTSNLGSQAILEAGGTITPQVKKILEPLLVKHFRPEIINRIDTIAYFNSFAPQDLERIAFIQLNRLHHTLAEKGITLTVTPQAIQRLITVGYKKEFGARPLKRAIQDYIVSPLATEIIKNPEKKHFIVDVQEGIFVIK